LRNGGTGDLTVSGIAASALQTLVINTSGSAGIVLSSAELFGTALTTITIAAENSNAADVTLSGGLNSGKTAGMSTLETVTISAKSGADVTLGAMNIGGDDATTASVANAVTFNASFAGSESIITLGAISATAADLVFNIGAGDGGTAGLVVGNIVAGGTTALGSLTVNAVLATAQSATFGTYSGSSQLYTLGTANLAVSATLTLGEIDVADAALSLGTITMATGSTVTVGVIDASAVAATTVTLGSGADFVLGNVTASKSIGNLTITGATASTVIMSGMAASSTIGAVAITLASGATYLNNNSGSTTTGDAFVAAKSISGFTLTLATGASADIGVIEASAIGDVEIKMGSSSTTIIDGIQATGAAGSGGVLSSVTFSGAGSITVGDIHAASGGSIGAVRLTLATGNTADITSLGDANDYIESLTISVASGASADIATLQASAIGSITITGTGTVNLPSIKSSSTIGTADFSGASGIVVANFSGVASVPVIKAGHGTNTIDLGTGASTVTLFSGSASDSITIFSTGTNKQTIVGFEAGTSRDVLILDATTMVSGTSTTTGMHLIEVGSGSGVTALSTVSLMNVTASMTLTTGSNIIVLGTGSYTSLADMKSAITTGGSLALTMPASGSAGGLLVLWTDTSGGANLSVITASTGAVLATGASASTLVTFSAVTAGAFVAANFDVV